MPPGAGINEFHVARLVMLKLPCQLSAQPFWKRGRARDRHRNSRAVLGAAKRRPQSPWCDTVLRINYSTVRTPYHMPIYIVPCIQSMALTGHSAYTPYPRKAAASTSRT